jgi:hypothetical protein
MDYSKLSDFEINKRVAESLGVNFTQDGLEIYIDVFDEQHGDFFPEPLNYCNNPSDAWPIIVENKISITSTSEKERPWCAYLWEDDCESWGVNPLRQCMIVYLMMKESNNA